MDPQRLKPWAIACSIYRASCILKLESKSKFSIRPKIYDQSSISFGDDSSLVFEDKELLKLNEKMFIMPRILSILRCPYLSLIKIYHLIKIGELMRSSEQNILKLKLLLGVGLEATATYMNHNPKCREIIGREEGRVDFFVKGMSSPLMCLQKKGGAGWKVSEFDEYNSEPRVKMTFQDLEIGILSCKNILNHQVSSALGEYDIVGYIPLMEKIGYCAKLTNLEIPLLEK